MKRFNIILFLLALVVLTVEAKDLRVAGIFGNNMVLQQKDDHTDMGMGGCRGNSHSDFIMERQELFR